jgi:hypothetical protein
VTSELEKLPHGIRTIGEELQIIPGDLHRMLRRLRMAVEHVISVAKNNPKFEAPAAKLPELREEEIE